MIADTDDGIYMETNRSWSIDDKRLNFQFGTEIGLGDQAAASSARMVKNPTYTGITPRVLGQLRRDRQPRRLDRLGHAQLRQGPARAGRAHRPRRAAARFRNVQVGIMQ